MLTLHTLTSEEERDNVEKEVGDALDENFKAMTEKQETREKRISTYCLHEFSCKYVTLLLVYLYFPPFFSPD